MEENTTTASRPCLVRRRVPETSSVLDLADFSARMTLAFRGLIPRGARSYSYEVDIVEGMRGLERLSSQTGWERSLR